MASYQAVLNGVVTNIQAILLGGGNTLPTSCPSDASGNPVSITNPLQVGVQNVTRSVSVTPTVTATTYALSKVMGGIMTFAGILPAQTPWSATLESINLKFKGSSQTVGFWVAIFTGSPAGTFTDTNTAAIAAADTALLVGLYHLTGGTSVLGTHTSFSLTNIFQGINGSSGSLFAVVVPDATSAALGSTSDMTLTLGTLWG